jgi:hypothetical protein
MTPLFFDSFHDGRRADAARAPPAADTATLFALAISPSSITPP